MFAKIEESLNKQKTIDRFWIVKKIPHFCKKLIEKGKMNLKLNVCNDFDGLIRIQYVMVLEL